MHTVLWYRGIYVVQLQYPHTCTYLFRNLNPLSVQGFRYNRRLAVHGIQELCTQFSAYVDNLLKKEEGGERRKEKGEWVSGRVGEFNRES